jgi:hypothetical protein
MPLDSSPPRNRARFGARFWVFVAGLAGLGGLAWAGCYNPSLGEKLVCNKMYEPGSGDCPDGFHCGLDNLCHRGAGGAIGGTGGIAGAGGVAGNAGGTGGHVGGSSGSTAGSSGSGGSGGSPVDAGVDAPQSCINTPISMCTADLSGGKLCDPVCQVGCGCRQKCSTNTAGTLTCNEPLSMRPKALGEGCNPASVGTAAQTDDCMPGLVCVQDACSNHCFRFCKSDADCPLSTCSRVIGGGVKVCEVQRTTCNPVKNNGMPSGCPAAAQACFIIPDGSDATLCDCPGDSPANAQCTLSRDCFPGLVCVDIGGTGSGICRPACGLATGATDCPGTTCTKIKGSTKFGYCSN